MTIQQGECPQLVSRHVVWILPGPEKAYAIENLYEPAFILIFKGQRGEDDEVFLEYLRELAGRLKEEQARGQPFRLDQLPPEHPAQVFARRVKYGGEKTGSRREYC